MPKTFEELMEQFRNPGETGVPETFADDLAETYQHDLSVRDAVIAEREAAIAEKENAIAERDAEVIRVKAVNYDLMKAATNNAGNPADNNEPDGDAAQGGIDSLFG